MLNISKKILLVEDSDEDFATFIRIKEELQFPHRVYRACDGDEALDYFYHTGVYVNADPNDTPRPSLIVLDLNLPGTDGRDVLKKLKQDPEFKTIPIVILTTSANTKDMELCYSYGANSYLMKPMSVPQLKIVVHSLFRYWLEMSVATEHGSLHKTTISC